MNLLTNILHVVGTGASAYVLARNLRDPLTRPNLLMRFYLSEYTSVRYLEALKERASQEGNQWLSEQLARHAADELKHSRIFQYALKQAGHEAIDPESLASEKELSPLMAAYFEGYSHEQLIPSNIEWITYAGSTYILEYDSGKDYARMANVLPDSEPKLRQLKQGLLSVAQDESRHATYLYETLTRRLLRSEVESVVEYWRTRKTRALWSMAGNLIKAGGKI